MCILNISENKTIVIVVTKDEFCFRKVDILKSLKKFLPW